MMRSDVIRSMHQKVEVPTSLPCFYVTNLSSILVIHVMKLSYMHMLLITNLFVIIMIENFKS